MVARGGGAESVQNNKFSRQQEDDRAQEHELGLGVAPGASGVRCSPTSSPPVQLSMPNF